MTKKIKVKENKLGLRQELSVTKRKVTRVLIHILLWILVLINIFPLYWMITFSLKSNDEIQGYKKSADKTRWEEIEEAIVGVTGNATDIAWDSFERAIINTSNTAARKDPALSPKDHAAREEEIADIIRTNWSNIKDSISSIEGIFDEDRIKDIDMSNSDDVKAVAHSEQMTAIYAEIEEIINSTVAKEIPVVKEAPAKTDSSDETADVGAQSDAAYVYNFVFSTSDRVTNDQKRIMKAMSRLYQLQNSEVQDPWESIKASVGNMMGDDMKDMLDQPETEYVQPNHVGLPSELHWENYESALKIGKYYDPDSSVKRNTMAYYFLNSLVVSASAIVITIMAAFMATYAMTRLVWKGRKTMNKFFMLGLTIPIHAAIVPVYMILSRLGWLNTYQALIIPYAAFSLAMAILISVGFMGDIPYDLDEAAFLDGCGIWGIFFRVIVPLMMPAVATVGIYTFLQCWNELLFATIFVSDGKFRTLPVGVQQLFGQYTTDWGPIGAALSIATLPTLIVYIALSKKIQAGFIAGAVKG